MSRPYIDLTGQVFGRLTAAYRTSVVDGAALWACLCSCGGTKLVTSGALRGGNTRSCGCLDKEVHTKHGRAGTRAYKTWAGMLQRCENQKNPRYADYGGRGITVCKRWHAFENFYADMGDPPAEMTLERRDNNLGYFPNNCKWATYTEQNRNRRVRKDAVRIRWRGAVWAPSDLAQRLGIGIAAVRCRVRSGELNREVP